MKLKQQDKKRSCKFIDLSIHVLEMHKLLIKDFSLQVHTDFECALSEPHADLPGLANSMLSKFAPQALKPEDVTLSSDKKLYDYRLQFKLFGGSVDVAFTSQAMDANFRNISTAETANYIFQIVGQIWELAIPRPILINQISFFVHAQFDQPESFAAYMSPFINAERGHTSGGKIIWATTQDFSGELRFAVEKSLGIERGIFISAQFRTKEHLTADLLGKMAKQSNEALFFDGLEIIFP